MVDRCVLFEWDNPRILTVLF